MVRAAKKLKRRAVELDFDQLRLDFISAGVKTTPIYPYGCHKNDQPFYSTIQKSRITSKIIGPNTELTTFIEETIIIGLKLLRALVLNPEVNFIELKSISTIITTYLPERSRDNEELTSTIMWGKFTRNLTRSNRRTSMFRLTQAAQVMGNEIPALKNSCEKLVYKIYRLIRGDTEKIFDAHDRSIWKAGLESKPKKFFRVGSNYHDKL